MAPSSELAKLANSGSKGVLPSKMNVGESDFSLDARRIMHSAVTPAAPPLTIQTSLGSRDILGGGASEILRAILCLLRSAAIPTSIGPVFLVASASIARAADSGLSSNSGLKSIALIDTFGRSLP